MNNQTINQLNNRELDECYFSIICIPVSVYFKDTNLSTNKTTFYLFFGCNINGVRKFISAINIKDYTKVSDYYDFFLNLKSRKINLILYALIPSNPILKKGLELAFPKLKSFISPYEPINKIFKYYPCKYSSTVFKDIKNIYNSNDLNDYEVYINTFFDNHSNSLFLKDLLENYFIQVKNYIPINKLLRKHIFSIYFLREIDKKITVISHSKDYFLSTDDFVNELIPTIKTIESKMYCSKHEWVDIINIIYENDKELIKSYL